MRIATSIVVIVILFLALKHVVNEKTRITPEARQEKSEIELVYPPVS